MPPDSQNVLILGAGLVARPAVRYLLDLPGLTVTVASRTVAKARDLVQDHPRGRALALDVDDRDALDALVARHDLTLSLLPAQRHVEVAESCLRHGRHMATTSYISPGMRALDAPAREAGLLFLNECGVDPGLDHMSAMRIFDGIHDRGGRVTVFKSYCGGLPAPEANDNPLGYKFSWAPRGVLLAVRNGARFRWDGQLVEVAPSDLLATTHTLEVPGVGTFEAYPNRDSLSYEETYGLPGLETLYRGTLRYAGHCARWKAWVDLGLFEIEPIVLLDRTRAGMLRALLNVDREGDLPAEVAHRLGLARDADPVVTLGWLGMYDEVCLPEGMNAPLDVLADAMLAKMAFQPGERDMLVMHHEVVGVFPGRTERITMDLVDFGIPRGDSSMARTVSLPVAVGVKHILAGRIQARGVHAPVRKEIYVPILGELEALGISCVERTEIL
ncbi:MAG: saccharopine dehydrogenase NADP-binding domain-containing protein [Deltaproteobacteria bacterium]|nr:saccharopine dehydrogenase NADP-binding domain-containing protein [Deltaproteobacteria bacterium]